MWQFNVTACFLIFIIWLQNINARPEDFRRIVGGEVAEYIPWFVSVSTKGLICGGSAISKIAVVTAAHCFNEFTDVEDMFIYHGKGNKYNRPQIKIKSAIIHPHYFKSEDFWLHNDIAVAFLVKPLDDFVKWIGPPPKSGIEVWVAGYGGTLRVNGDYQSTTSQIYSDVLKKTKLKLVDQEECTAIHNIKLDYAHICAFGNNTSSCQGDSGGPLYGFDKDGNHLLYAIVSFGHGCADNRYPILYTRISSYQPWIEDTLKSMSDVSGMWRGPK